MKTSKPAKKIQYFISIVTVITTVSLSSLSVLAFDEHIVTEATTVYLEEGETVFSSINDNEITAITINLPNEVGVTCYVIDTEGNITIINENNQKVFCDHNYKDITYVMHTKYSDGSCREVYYDAQRCFNCDRVIVGDEINTITYKKCIH